MTAVDTRFAGGPIIVERGEIHGQPVIDIEIPGGSRIPLFAHEADQLAEALLDRGGPTLEGINRREAADIIVLVRDARTHPDHIRVEADHLELDRDAALTFAMRLIELAAQLPDPPRILRRRGDVDEQLSHRDG